MVTHIVYYLFTLTRITLFMFMFIRNPPGHALHVQGKLASDQNCIVFALLYLSDPLEKDER